MSSHEIPTEMMMADEDIEIPDEDTDGVVEPETPESTPEQEIQGQDGQESEENQEVAEPPAPENLQELLDLWRQEYEIAEGTDKQELAYRVVKLSEAVMIAKLNPGLVAIRTNAAGVSGFYDTSTGEVAITPEGIGLPADHYQGILIHESIHAGKFTGRKVGDEGLTETITQLETKTGGEGVYQQERTQTAKTFEHLDLHNVIEAYNFDNPAELLDLYFTTEWKLGLNGELNSLITPEIILHPEARPAFIEGLAQNWVQQKERALRDAMPRLLEEAEGGGFDFKATHLRCLNGFIEQS